MPGWLEAYEQLNEATKDRVQRWIHLNKFIAHTLRIPWEKWMDDYVKSAMDKPMDYRFLAPLLEDFAGLDVEGQGVSFTKELDPSKYAVSRVPLRAKNNLGRLSPDLQDRIGAMLEGGDAEPSKLLPSDVTMLQKIFPAEKALSKLPKPSFRKVHIAREEDDMILSVEGGAELVRMNVLEFGAVMSRALV